jgi:DNA/RNA-binding domain of Phe-tRNA-synthetase-like protein
MSESDGSDTPQITSELAGVRLGVVVARGVTVGSASAELEREIAELSERLQKEMKIEQLAGREPLQAVRAMFRGWGLDPTSSRPSGEQLLRRVLQGKGLYRVSNVVDLNNLGSCETGWPWGSFDLDRLRPPLVFRHGRAGESYLAIGKEEWSVAGKPVMCDAEGPFGGPIRDSQRTMLTPATRNLLTVIFAPSSAALETVRRAAQQHARRMAQFAGAAETQAATIHAQADAPGLR